ncbi:unnamed protein product [Rotaria sp. Silwood1]|nr:unnamed protein product [Rotaria sp. Silwood1]CAF1278389.1 unnamed protein product [Rotaria sp. Silwood1]CAF3476966.1 unnamed protein product [Rotaria sp. Silwood1]CAF4880915.1 unnamed protein product [Rotaria sp. Silwood1]
MFISGVPLAKIDDENNFKSQRLSHRNASESVEFFKVVDEVRQNNEYFHKDLRKRAAFTSNQRQFQREVLSAHNFYRARHCAKPLQLNDVLSRSAQNFAQKLANTNQFHHSGTPGVGENLYMAISSKSIKVNGNAPVTAWYNEIQHYNFNRGGFSKITGHFTQVVWRSTTKLGVGIAYANGGRSIYVVTRYSPPGNYAGQYQANVRRQGSC